MTQSMKDALKGQGSGLQGVSQAVGDMWAGETKSGGQKKSDEASSSLGQFANPSKGGVTTEGTSVSGADQVKNMSTGTADHLDMGFRKSE